MKIYIATKFQDGSKAKALAEKLESLGHTITCKWWEADQSMDSGCTHEELKQYAIQDWYGVLDANCIVLLTVEHGGRGMYTELGIALALGKEIVAVGPHLNNIFYFMPSIHKVENELELTLLLTTLDSRR